jgi:hypothetical protein
MGRKAFDLKALAKPMVAGLPKLHGEDYLLRIAFRPEGLSPLKNPYMLTD